MRMQVHIPEELAMLLKNLATAEVRTPRQQAELLLRRAIKKTAGKLLQPQPAFEGAPDEKG